MKDMLQDLTPWQTALAFVAFTVLVYPAGKALHWFIWRIARWIAKLFWGEVGIRNVDDALHPDPASRRREFEDGDS